MPVHTKADEARALREYAEMTNVFFSHVEETLIEAVRECFSTMREHLARIAEDFEKETQGNEK